LRSFNFFGKLLAIDIQIFIFLLMQIQNLQTSLFVCQNLIAENRFIKKVEDRIENEKNSERESIRADINETIETIENTEKLHELDYFLKPEAKSYNVKSHNEFLEFFNKVYKNWGWNEEARKTFDNGMEQHPEWTEYFIDLNISLI
jgi:hypothetical protein